MDNLQANGQRILLYSVENASLERSASLEVTKRLIKRIAAINAFQWIARSSPVNDDNPRLSLLSLFAWKFRSEVVLRRWSRLRPNLAKQVPVFIGATLTTLRFAVQVATDENFRSRQSLASGTEQIITAKHLDGWLLASSLDVEWLIVLEDDALVSPESDFRVTQLFQFLKTLNPNRSSYIDIGGGFSPEILGVEYYPSLSNHFQTVVPPAGNTACAYVLSRAGISRFTQAFANRAQLSSIGVDFAINAILCEVSSDFAVFHQRPPALVHGSMNGFLESWDSRNKN